jgi:tetratricopeptide (TPR) repeat protein
MAIDPETVDAWVGHGVALCKEGNWEQGLAYLTRVVEGSENPADALPPIASSYLGHALARKGRLREARERCEEAAKEQFYQPEVLVNLAHVYMLAGERQRAFAVVQRGLKLDAGHRGLLALHDHLGERLPPVLSFLSRGNFLNTLLGRLRRALRPAKSAPPPPRRQPPAKRRP